MVDGECPDDTLYRSYKMKSGSYRLAEKQLLQKYVIKGKKIEKMSNRLRSVFNRLRRNLHVAFF